MDLSVKIIGVNFSGNGFPAVINADYFRNLKDEIEIEEISVNGVSFHGISGYSKIADLLDALEDDSSTQPLEILAIALKHKLAEPDQVIEFCDNHLIEYQVYDASANNLREVLAVNMATEKLESICQNLSKADAEFLHQNFDFNNYQQSLEINDWCYFCETVNGTPYEVVFSNR